MEQSLALVAVEHVAYHFDILYGYLVPQQMQQSLQTGMRVLVPFGQGKSARRQGVVFELTTPQDGQTYKSVLSVLDTKPLFSPEMLALAAFLKDRTFCTFFEAARVQLPTGFHLKTIVTYLALQSEKQHRLSEEEQTVYHYLLDRAQYLPKKEILAACHLPPDCDAIEKLTGKGLLHRNFESSKMLGNISVRTAQLSDTVTSEDDLPQDLTEKQRRVAEVLLDIGSASVKELCYFTGVSTAVINNLVKRNVIELFDADLYRTPKPLQIQPDAAKAISLTAQQQCAFDGLYHQYQSGGGVALLYGITGSGKTSVFLRLIDDVLRDGKQVIVMVPEIALTPQMMSIFKGRYGEQVAIFHSALSAGERKDEYRRVQDGLVKIAVGTRSAVFAPFRQLGLIVMDEEQEHTYKSESTPRYHARDVARWRAKRHGALLLLSSATPSLESYALAKKGIYRLETLSERYGDAVLPDVTVIDMKRDRQRGNKHTISIDLCEMLQENLDNGKQSILLMNRRGYNTFVACDNCGDVITCPSCSISLTYHAANGRLMCHYCGYSQPFTNVCSHCGKPNLRYAGTGTQKIEEELKQLFPAARVVRMDTDSTMTREAFEKHMLAFGKGEYDIMLGTQMVAKGLNFENVTLVGVLNADLSLHNDDFRSEERTFDLLTQVVGRAGRGREKGRAVIQTLNPENDVIRLSQSQDYDAFFKNEILIRKVMTYPPYCDICTLNCISENENKALQSARLLLDELRDTASRDYPQLHLIVLPVMPPRIARMNNKFRYRIIIKCKNNAAFRSMIALLLRRFQALPQFRDVTFTADINPETLI